MKSTSEKAVEPVELEYPYQPRLAPLILGAGGFGYAAAFLVHQARTNDRGLLINGIIRLTTEWATGFYWVLAFFSLCFVGMALTGVINRLRFQKRIAITPTGIITPASIWSSAEKTIEYRDIVDVTETETNGQRLLHVTHAGGTTRINTALLPSRKAFGEIRRLIDERMREL